MNSNKKSGLLQFVDTAKQWINQNYTALTAFGLALIVGFFFILVRNPAILLAFKQNDTHLDLINLRVFTGGLFIAYVALLSSVCRKIEGTQFQKIAIWLNSFILMIVSFGYALRLFDTQFSLFNNITISTGAILIPLTLLVYLVNYNLFVFEKRNTALVFFQTLLFVSFTFSTINFIINDKTGLRVFSQEWANWIFHIHAYFWYLFCALAVALVAGVKLNTTHIKTSLMYAGLLSLILFQAMVLLHSIQIESYWYQTTIILILWDFLYLPLIVAFEQVKDTHFKPKLIISSVYHGFLFLVVFYWYIFGKELLANIIGA